MLSVGDNHLFLHRTYKPLTTTCFTFRSFTSSLKQQLDTSVSDDDRKLTVTGTASFLPPVKFGKRVVLVRHGQSTWNAEGRIQGSSDYSVLTPKGEAQAETSRQMLIDDSFDICFSRFVSWCLIALVLDCGLDYDR